MRGARAPVSDPKDIIDPQMPDPGWSIEQLREHRRKLNATFMSYATSVVPKNKIEAALAATVALIEEKGAGESESISRRHAYVMTTIGVVGGIVAGAVGSWVTFALGC